MSLWSEPSGPTRKRVSIHVGINILQNRLNARVKNPDGERVLNHGDESRARNRRGEVRIRETTARSRFALPTRPTQLRTMSLSSLPLVSAPTVSLTALDQLWFQVAGTVCNLRCRHCFISCAPDNHSLWFLSRQEVAEALDESAELGVKEYYFTGGEPFMNRELEGMLEDTLRIGPATVLTNGTLLPDRRVERLGGLAGSSRYTLEFRVSIDGVDPATNDAIRGPGTFARALEGVGRLVGEGFLPIITTMQSWPDHETDRILSDFREVLARIGYDRPRLKIVPPLLMGAEAERTRAYVPTERVTAQMMAGYDVDLLLCSRARLVTSRGVLPCPILADEPDAVLARRLRDSVDRPAQLGEQACYTCYVHGAICANVSLAAGDFG